jgi:hypothetical protein
MLPEHGKISCRKCFSETDKGIVIPHASWKMINDPGAWGSSSPEYLVLGFSKGATQAGIYNEGHFEDIAFAGMRKRLTQALVVMGVLDLNESVDDKISDPSSSIAFGSLIRCSVSRIDEKVKKTRGDIIYSCTGPLIGKSFTEIPHVINNCTRKYLKELPNSVKAVFMLGNSDSYVSNCQNIIKNLFPASYRSVNSMAVFADNRLWVHLAHPSGLNGHFNNWIKSDVGPGGKRILAKEALQSLVNERL